MKIVMLGAGALGSTIGGTLASTNEVHFVDTVSYTHLTLPTKLEV